MYLKVTPIKKGVYQKIKKTNAVWKYIRNS